MDFTITYNDGKGKLTLYCDYFFEKHNAACIVDTIFGAEKVIRNLKKNTASAFTKELLSALCGEDEKHE